MAVLHDPGWKFEHSYAQLPEAFFSQAQPAPVGKPALAMFNHALAEEMGLDFRECSDEELAEIFSGKQLPAGSNTIAQAYAGHQYGGFTILGDGRAMLIGEHRTPDGTLLDIQFKGSGPTTYSRRGDGLAVLGPMLREYLISEAMHALDIPTTRSLAVVTTGKPVFRYEMLPGAILTRIAASHIRVGTFQYFAARRDVENLKILADYTIQRHDPELLAFQDRERYRAFLHAVIDRQARLIAQWQCVGFVHGVMNTDNMALSGETIDYGPCAFMDRYHVNTVFSSIDDHGRYAYGNQPKIAQWNLARFAETLIPMLSVDLDDAVDFATKAVESFETVFQQYFLRGMRAKLGLQQELPDDEALIVQLLEWMQDKKQDFTNTFRSLPLPTFCADDADFAAWRKRWQARTAHEEGGFNAAVQRMQQVNPVVIPRNALVEDALQAAERENDYEPFHQLLSVLQKPFDVPSDIGFAASPDENQPRYRTYCGT
ncbi:MAG: YdiU family protein [Zavarzinella sp.]